MVADQDLTDQDLAEQFLAVVYADSDLLHAEFEAIVADWDGPGTARTGRWAVSPARRQTVADRFAVNGYPALADPEVDGWARERSPPATHLFAGTERQVIG